MSRLRRLVRCRAGYTLVELLLVLTILGTVLTGLMTAFASGTRAELDLNKRFQAQVNAALALGKLRQEVHCASSISPAGSSASITLTLPSQCTGGGGQVSWCTVASGSQFSLYRQAGATCSSSGKLYTQYLTTGTVFTYTAQSTTSLATLHVDFPVNANPSKTVDRYELADDIVLRNSTRS